MNDLDKQLQAPLRERRKSEPDSAGRISALTDGSYHADILFSSLAGVAAIVVILLVGLALPVFGRAPIVSMVIFIVLVVTSMIGVGALCIFNYRAHRQVTIQALLTEVLLNSLGQGFLSFDSSGLCGLVYSKACIELLEGIPAGHPIVDVLKLSEEQKKDFNDWMEMLFMPDHALGFDDVTKFLPQTYMHSGAGRHIALMYRPMRDRFGKLLSIVLIATDQTEDVEAQLRAKAQQNFVNMICRIFKERNQFMVTITHLRKFVAEAKVTKRQEEAAPILRLLHTLKAAAKHFYLDALNDVIHKLESDLHSKNFVTDEKFQERLYQGGEDVDACIKAILDQLGDLIGQDFEGRGNVYEVEEEAIYSFAAVMRDRKIAPDLIELYLLAIAAVPINDCFHQFDRELKDLAVIMGKKVKPILYTGTNPRVLAEPLEGFMLATMHICRNIVDHGIEPAVTRLARGKEPSGLVTIHTELIKGSQGERVLQIVISDDGNGIDPAIVRTKLAKIDPDGAWKNEDDEAIIQRIMQWEVSTKNFVTDLSGRGVGMEAVDREVRQLGGTIKVSSELYKGTRFDIRIPYNLDNIIGKKSA